MEDIENLNHDEFQYLPSHPKELRKFMALENNKALLTN